jgi:hypothetical protein
MIEPSLTPIETATDGWITCQQCETQIDTQLLTVGTAAELDEQDCPECGNAELDAASWCPATKEDH